MLLSVNWFFFIIKVTKRICLNHVVGQTNILGIYIKKLDVTQIRRIRVAEVECTRPPDVVNATWYEDKKSLRTRRVIYLCLPRYRLVSGQLWKVCGPRGNWTGVDPVCEGR